MSFDFTDLDGTRHLWDDVPRTYTRWAPGGTVQQTRPYTAEENARADAETAYATQAANEATILTRAKAALATNKTFLALPAPTNAQNAAQVKALTQQVNGLIRLRVGDLTATD